MRVRRDAEPASAEERAIAFLTDLPKVHERPGQPAHSGGLNVRLGRVMIDELQKLDSPSIIETGAGSSTLLFMMLGCSSVIAIAPDEKLGRRIYEEAEQRELDASVLTFINDRSERALPKLALDTKTRCQAALIDGNHGWPAVFVDFCYLNMMMDRGSILFVDDVQVYACAQLMLLLQAQPDYEFVRLDGKLATFRKATDKEFLPDFVGEPFIMMNTTGVALG
jgi:hypothetical protein